MPLRARTVGLAACLLLAVTACSDDPGPAADPPATPAKSSASTSPSPTIGDLASAPPDETAEQFIRRYYALANYVQESGDTAAYLAVSGPDCTSCRGFADEIAQIYRDGGSIRGGRYAVVNVRAEGNGQWLVTLNAQRAEYERRKGASSETLSGGQRLARLYLVSDQGRWIVALTEMAS